MNAVWPEALGVRPLTAGDAQQIAEWRYDGPWQIYSPGFGMSSEAGYLAVAGVDNDLLVGYCCSGVEARASGLLEESGVLDIGAGMHPTWVGQGHGMRFGATVLAYYREAVGARRLRAVVQSWNERSLRLTRILGFSVAGVHACEQNGVLVEYFVVVAG
jgi:RimJ/RimL family protein N-acetyltransferase